jgi:hypothetical protein
VDIIDCVDYATSPWFEGPFGFVLANPRPLRPITCTGAAGFFNVPSTVVLQIGEQLTS